MRAYRRRAAAKRNVTPEDAQETIKALRQENAHLKRLLAEAREQIPEAPVTFPITVAGGRWVTISSTSALRPGFVIRCRGDEESDHLILEKIGKSLQLQALQDGTIGTLSAYDAKANWKFNTRASVPGLLRKWREKRNVTA